MSVDELLLELENGNKKFMAGAIPNGETATVKRLLSIDVQNPKFTLFTCSDSRIPPEIIFGMSLGDIFTIRTAGHVLDEAALGSLEFAVGDLKTPLLIVLGHSSCAAIQKAMLTENFPGALGSIQKHIRSAIGEETDFQAAIAGNTDKTIQNMIYKSPVIATALNTQQLKIVAAYYDFASGKIIFSKLKY
jgi:carbonic anhydrase